jgi:hypothetical protein
MQHGVGSLVHQVDFTRFYTNPHKALIQTKYYLYSRENLNPRSKLEIWIVVSGTSNTLRQAVCIYVFFSLYITTLRTASVV